MTPPHKKAEKKKLKWGTWQIIQGEFRGVPMRIMFQLPYDWHVTHNSDHVKRYWAKYRKSKRKFK
jgi:hypothetical protein